MPPLTQLLSSRFVPVYRRNLLVWRKLAVASVLGNIADPLITLVAFGYGIGQWIREIDGVRYIVFLAAGSICMSTMMAASFEALYSAYSRMQAQKTWESIMNAPIELSDIVTAEWLWAATKSMFSGLAILAVILMLGVSHSPKLLLVIPVVGLIGVLFAAIGLCFNALAKGYDFFSYYFTLVLTPMIFVCGVYYPLTGLPDWLAAIARWMPLSAAVELVRPLVLDQWPAHAARHLLVLLTYIIVAYLLAQWLTHRRFRS
jgi:lipooligosaccharide transport system permease protein